MFTGIVEEIGEIKSIRRISHSIKLNIHCSKVLGDTKIGDSIATDGVCLTVTQVGKDFYEADLMPETLKTSNFSSKKVGSKVNLERAMMLGDRFGGHMVSGHIDGTGTIKGVTRDDIAFRIYITCNRELLKYMIKKGSITIDGISLTIVSLDDNGFEVSVIPQTQADTTLLGKGIGELVNLENDLIGKYVERMTTFSDKRGIDKSFLDENGFL